MKNKGKLIVVLLLSSLMLSSCDGAAFTADDFLNKLFPNPWDALMIFCAFLVLLLVAFFFLYKPLKAYQKKRGDYVEGKIKEAEQREEDSKGLVELANQNVEDSKKESLEIIEKAKEDANKQKAIILDEAKQEALKVKEQAQKDIAQEIEASKDEIHREIVSVAIDASEKVLGREINDKDNERLVEDFVKELNKDK